MKRGYFYLFYKFYKFSQWSPSIFPSNSVAVLDIMSLELFVLLSMYNYYAILFKQNWYSECLSIEFLAPVLFIPIFNSFIFFKDRKWEDYIKEFDSWPREKNASGTWIVVGIILFIAGNLIFSFYLNPPLGGWK
jgi:hypothetical protein